MKKYKYKLEPLLKLRELQEYTVKLELGKLNKLMTRLKNKKESLIIDIERLQQQHDEMYKNQGNIAMLSHFAMAIISKREHIKKIESEITDLNVAYNEKLQDLMLARGKVKVINNLKDADKRKFKKEQVKKINEELEEIFLIRNNRDKVY